MSEVISIFEEVFAELQDRKFNTYKDFERSVVEAFNRNLDKFPAHFSYRQLLEYASHHNWVQREGDKVFVKLA